MGQAHGRCFGNLVPETGELAGVSGILFPKRGSFLGADSEESQRCAWILLPVRETHPKG